MSGTSFAVVAALSLATSPLLPPELLLEVFMYLCLMHDPLHLSFHAVCCRVSLVCRFWRDVANASRCFRYHLIIDPNSSETALSAFIRDSGSRPLSVTFTVRRCQSDPSDLHSFLASAALISHSIHRWDALAFYLDRPPVARALVQFFSLLSAPLLLSLSFHCVFLTAYDREPSYEGLPSVFQGHFPLLRHLVLKGLPLPWPSLRPFPALVDLRLAALPQADWPSFAAFTQVLVNSPDLRCLSLGAIGFTDMPSSLPTILLPDIVTLELTLSLDPVVRTATMWLGISCLDLPNLACLRVLSISTWGIRSLLLSPVTFVVPNVVLTGSDPGKDAMRCFYSRLSNVRSLDLRDGAAVMVSALSLSAVRALPVQLPLERDLLPASDPPAIVLPSLSRLAMFPPDWNDLRSVHDARLGISASAWDVLRCDAPSRPHLTYGFAVDRMTPKLTPMSSVLHVPAPQLLAYRAVLHDIPDFAWLPPRPVPVRILSPGYR
ncbi:hypothetical protein DFH06DRAFT_1346721 [Mycena polygramma]|nr:hypothetical protein DFH06DRAFT_1348934 [Mycena polygramma]KAJ7608887.1 hypothetical protein DFH06DRAFT_1346721 [Mycena polygramma]